MARSKSAAQLKLSKEYGHIKADAVQKLKTAQEAQQALNEVRDMLINLLEAKRIIEAFLAGLDPREWASPEVQQAIKDAQDWLSKLR